MAADNVFNETELCTEAYILLPMLDYKLASPTLLDYLYAFRNVPGLVLHDKEWEMWCYVSELALRCHAASVFWHYSLAMACVILARFALQVDDVLWPSVLETELYAMKITDETAQKCTVTLMRQCQEIAETCPEFVTVQRRYSKASRKKVADIALPNLTSFEPLLSYHRRRSTS